MTDSTGNTSTETQNNPYTAPEADLNTVTPGNGITVFDRFSAWGVFGLAIITLGIYTIYWLFSRTKQLNSVVENKISDGFIITTIVLYLINIISSYAPLLGFAVFLEPAVIAISGVLSIVSGVLFIVWAFKLRNRINQITNSEKGDVTRLGPILTFFFSCIYLQYKINQNLDILNSQNS